MLIKILNNVFNMCNMLIQDIIETHSEMNKRYY